MGFTGSSDDREYVHLRSLPHSSPCCHYKITASSWPLINGLNRPPTVDFQRGWSVPWKEEIRGHVTAPFDHFLKEVCVRLISMIMCDCFYQGRCCEQNNEDVFTAAARRAFQQVVGLASAVFRFNTITQSSQQLAC